MVRKGVAALHALFQDLKRQKPQGWSVVWGEAQIIVRPADRAVGKFFLAQSDAKDVYVSFFRHTANCWTDSESFNVQAGGEPILNWMVAQVHAAALLKV